MSRHLHTRAVVGGCLIVLGATAWVTRGNIPLRGLVTSQARIQLVSRIEPNVRMPLTMSAGGTATGAVRLRFADLSAIPSGVDVMLSSANATTAQVPALVSEYGVSVPYRFVFNGREVSFIDGKADLLTVTSGYREDAAGAELKAVTSPIPNAAAESFSDDVVLSVVVR